MTTVWVGAPARVPIGPDTFTLIAGPCAVETAAADAGGGADGAGRRARRCCAAARSSRAPRRTRSRAWARPACGSSPTSARRPGCRSSPRSIDAADVELVASYADMLQVGTRNMQNFALLQAVGAAGKPVMLKRGMTATIEEWLMAAEYIAQRGNLDIVLCERGHPDVRDRHPQHPGHQRRCRSRTRLSHLPVDRRPVALRRPARPRACRCRRAAIAVGADGIIVDVHPHPEAALCDGAGADRRPAGAGDRGRQLPPLLGKSLTPPEPASGSVG